MEEGIGRAAEENPGRTAAEEATAEETAAAEETEAASLLERIRAVFPGKKQDLRTYSALTLAYIGDAVYDMIIRTMVVERGNRPVRELHRITVRYVSAAAQAEMMEALMERLTEEEMSIYRRGRNAKPYTKAKNVSMEDYLKATGFEAVLGYLYLKDDMERVLELVRGGLEDVGALLR